MALAKKLAFSRFLAVFDSVARALNLACGGGDNKLLTEVTSAEGKVYVSDDFNL